MKKVAAFLGFIFFCSCSFAQEMHVRSFNFNSFTYDYKKITEVLDKYSSDSAKRHPEYGIAPYNTQCFHCVELIDKRTVDSRQYLDEYDAFRTYTQKSYFPLHYRKSLNDVWHTIDPRLRPDSAHAGVFIADRQPCLAKYDANSKTCTLKQGSFQFDFNQNLKLYFFDEDVAYTTPEPGNYKNYSVGDDGVQVKEIWKDINMQHKFSFGKIETDFQIKAPLQLPMNKGWMVIEDHFSLPEGTTMVESPAGHHLKNGYYQGDYIVKSAQGDSLLVYGMPVYVDAKAYGMHGMYKLQKSEIGYTLQMLVPIDWLSRTDHTYPLMLDPPAYLITNDSTIGDFTVEAANGGPPKAALSYTSMALGSCDYHIDSLYVGGKSALTNAYVDLEYTLTYDDSCGPNPYEPAPYCTFSQVTEQVGSDACGIYTPELSCNPAQAPYTGTCTTDPNLVPGAHSLNLNSLAPGFLACVQPQCPDYYLNFTLKDRDSICGDVCGYLCATGNMWRMTVEACRVNGDITPLNSTICAGQPVTFSASPQCGVPPYHFMWITLYDTAAVPDTVIIYDNNTYTISPPANITVSCILFDTCNENWPSSFASVSVTQSPPANAGDDTFLCGGGTVILGGNPTTQNATTSWAGNSPLQTSWLSNTAVANPTLNVPGNQYGTFVYVVTATNPQCFRNDTVRVASGPLPVATIDTNGPIVFCSRQGVTLAVPDTFVLYLWSNGSTSSSITVYSAGSYSVIVTDSIGCKGTSPATQITIADVLKSPLANPGDDTTLCNGGEVVLGGNPTTDSATIQWSGNTSLLSSTTVANPTVNIPAGTYGAFTFILTTTNNQCTSTDSVVILAAPGPVPVIDTTGSTTFCVGQSVQLAVVGSYASYIWSNGSRSPSITIGQTGSYFVTVTDSNNCTGASGATQILNASPPAFSVYPDTTIYFGDSIALRTNLNFNLVDSFIWYPDINISCLDCYNPFVSPKAQQYYGLTVYDGGCVVSDSVLINVILPNNFYIPNVFSPNGDGNNDYFYIFCQSGVTVISFEVFDRWGEKVHDGNYPWDGNYRGKPAPVGVYTYIFQLGLYGNLDAVISKGSVTLLR